MQTVIPILAIGILHFCKEKLITLLWIQLAMCRKIAWCLPVLLNVQVHRTMSKCENDKVLPVNDLSLREISYELPISKKNTYKKLKKAPLQEGLNLFLDVSDIVMLLKLFTIFTPSSF